MNKKTLSWIATWRCTFLAAAVLFASDIVLMASPFVHPGLLQNRADLEFMRQQVLAGKQPWKKAWENLLKEPYSSLDFKPKPVAHVVRGPYGRPSIGDRALMKSANAAYSQALQWVVTGNKVHARKAIEILNAWSDTLWNFEDNDAKLLAGWTGHAFCNAAEILRYTNAGWKQKDVQQFKRMLLTVYYPLIKNYFPQANGNWDGAMIDTTLCIGVFCNNHDIFDSAVNHFRRGTGNGGITKYVYPSGQCEETTRDQNHTQLGLGEFAQACQVAWTQGVNLFGAADNRLAVGYEYTARYMLGETNPVYGLPSTEGRGRFSDVYEVVLNNYRDVEGFEMPYTARAVERTHAGRGWSALIMCRTPGNKIPPATKELPSSSYALQAGALLAPTATPPANAIVVPPGQSIQAALDAHGTNGVWIVLAKGLHVLKEPLRIPSGVTLAGEGLETILFLDPAVTADRAGTTIVNASDDLHDVTLRDFLIEGATTVPPTSINSKLDYTYVSGSGSDAIKIRPMRLDPNQDRRRRSYQMAPSRAGIAFSAQHDGQMSNLHFVHVTVRNCTHDGVAIRGAEDVTITACNFSDNGSSVPPGPGLLHNLLLNHVEKCRITGCRLDDSPWGSGLDVSFGSDIVFTNNEAARNALCGVHVTESSDVQVSGNLAEGNDHDGFAFETWMDGCRNVEIFHNTSRNNGNCGIKLEGVNGGLVDNNLVSENGTTQQTTVVGSRSIKR